MRTEHVRLVMVVVGGGLGSLLRYLLAGWCQALSGGTFPVGTLAVNVIGCFFIGLLNCIFAGPVLIRPEYRIGLTVGVLGGFTTFSTFGYETFRLASDGQALRAIGNVVLSVVLGLVAVMIGYRLGQRWLGA